LQLCGPAVHYEPTYNKSPHMKPLGIRELIRRGSTSGLEIMRTLYQAAIISIIYTYGWHTSSNTVMKCPLITAKKNTDNDNYAFCPTIDQVPPLDVFWAFNNHTSLAIFPTESRTCLLSVGLKRDRPIRACSPTRKMCFWVPMVNYGSQ